MCIETKKCCAWISLSTLGVPSSPGCARNVGWLSSVSVPCNQSIFNQDIYIDLPDTKMTYLRTVSHGKFGSIDEVSYETSDGVSKLYVKRPIIAGKNLTYEACLQKIVGDSLATIGFPTGAPRLVRIFKLRDESICFAMEQIDNAVTLDVFLEGLPKDKLTNVIIDSLLQLTAMVWHLDMSLGINHRDLKPSNFLIVQHPEPVRKIISVEDEILEIESRCSLTFIDFGFSCLGSTKTHSSDISLSTVYSKWDPCPKEGRDIFLFLAFLYIDFWHLLDTNLLKLFESWLDVKGSNLCRFMRKDKENCKDWIYYVAGDERITQFPSTPIRIIKDLQNFL